jgi:uncharacterized protein
VPTDVFREGGVSYLRIPAPAPELSAGFYSAVFGWTINRHGDSLSFEDGSGHVIGHFMSDLDVAGSAGVIPYVFVRSIDAAIALVTSSGGTLVDEPYPEGELWVATVSDPAGNVIGVWQRGPRS